MSKNRKFFEDRIGKLNGIMAEAGAKINVANGGVPSIGMEEYVNSFRTRLNMVLIELCMGGEFAECKKGGYKIKFNHKMMNRTELATLSSLLDRYITGIEIPAVNSWLHSAPAAETDPAADMAIPESRPAGITVIEKINKKKLMAAIMGEGGVAGYSRMYLMVADLTVIMANAEKIRKKEKRNMAMIVGGIAIVVAAGVAVGIMIYRKHHKKSLDEEIQESLDDMNVDLDDSDGPEIDDTPHVDLGD